MHLQQPLPGQRTPQQNQKAIHMTKFSKPLCPHFASTCQVWSQPKGSQGTNRILTSRAVWGRAKRGQWISNQWSRGSEVQHLLTHFHTSPRAFYPFGTWLEVQLVCYPLVQAQPLYFRDGQSTKRSEGHRALRQQDVGINIWRLKKCKNISL
ncbi:hypothetical protein BKA83DRAFT_4128753 [Pisolithus microcarpus]|nr:hypothetical protein BKA83DRAFT_4128753 [Pisolithus microcarpus]